MELQILLRGFQTGWLNKTMRVVQHAQGVAQALNFQPSRLE